MHNDAIVEFADPQAAPRSSNKHVPVNPKGIELVDLQFIEEHGYGFPWIEFGDVIGATKWWGMNSSVWMAFDETYVLMRVTPHVILITSGERRDTSRSKPLDARPSYLRFNV